MNSLAQVPSRSVPSLHHRQMFPLISNYTTLPIKFQPIQTYNYPIYSNQDPLSNTQCTLQTNFKIEILFDKQNGRHNNFLPSIVLNFPIISIVLKHRTGCPLVDRLRAYFTIF